MQKRPLLHVSHQSVGEPIMHSNSNAVLTPELIHPNFFKLKQKHSHVNSLKRKGIKSKPVSSFETALRLRWASNQSTVMAQMPSTAVLGA